MIHVLCFAFWFLGHVLACVRRRSLPAGFLHPGFCRHRGWPRCCPLYAAKPNNSTHSRHRSYQSRTHDERTKEAPGLCANLFYLSLRTKDCNLYSREQRPLLYRRWCQNVRFANGLNKLSSPWTLGYSRLNLCSTDEHVEHANTLSTHQDHVTGTKTTKNNGVHRFFSGVLDLSHGPREWRARSRLFNRSLLQLRKATPGI